MKVFQRKLGYKFRTKLRTLILFSIFIPNITLASPPDPIRFGILSIAQPSRIYSEWTPFVNYLEKKLNRPISIIIPKGFGNMQQAIANKELDFFYVNSYVFYRMKQEGKALALAQMKNINGQIVSQSELFVRSDSNINSIYELKGKTIGFVSPMGAGGYLAPRAYLNINGVQAPGEVKMIFTKNLSTSLHHVLLGKLDVATMCGVNFELMSLKIQTGDLRIIGKSDPYPENVMAARSDIDPKIMQKLTDIFIDMPNHSDGQKSLSTLRDMKIQAFVPYDEESEKLTTTLVKQANLTP